MNTIYTYAAVFTSAPGSITLPSDVVPLDRPVYFFLSTHRLANKKRVMQAMAETTTATIPMYLRCMSVK